MKSYLILKTLILASFLLAVVSCNGYAESDKTPTLIETFDLDQPGTLITASSGGGISVESHDQNTVIVKVYIRANGILLEPASPKIEEVLEYYDLEISQKGNVIIAIARRKNLNKFWNNTGIYFSVIVPHEMSCDVSSSGGGVKASGVEGEHDFVSSGGSVKLENISGTIRASSSGGGVKALNIHGNINLTSSGGSVKVEEADGKIYAQSSGGGVHLYDIQGDVDARSSGGGVKITGELLSVKASSSGGSVNVKTGDQITGLDLKSSGGGTNATIQNGKELGLDLDLRGDRVNIDLNNFSGRSEKNSVNGTMNGGGIPVYMHASGGSTNLVF